MMYSFKILLQTIEQRGTDGDLLDSFGLTWTTRAAIMSHKTRELLEVDLAVTIKISLSNHGSNLGLSQGFTEVAHGQPQLFFTYQSITITIKYFKSMSNIIIETVSPLDHHVNKLV